MYLFAPEAQTGRGHPGPPIVCRPIHWGDPQTPRVMRKRVFKAGRGKKPGQERKRQKRERTGKGPSVRWGPPPILEVYAVPHLGAWLAWRETEPVGNWLRPPGSRQTVVHGRGRKDRTGLFSYPWGFGGVPRLHYQVSDLSE